MSAQSLDSDGILLECGHSVPSNYDVFSTNINGVKSYLCPTCSALRRCPWKREKSIAEQDYDYRFYGDSYVRYKYGDKLANEIINRNKKILPRRSLRFTLLIDPKTKE